MKIAILDDWSGSALDYADWASLGATIEVFSEPFASTEALVAALHPFDVVCLMRERTPLPAAVIEALPALKLIVTTGARNNAIDLVAARAAGITVCGTRARKTTTAELTLLLILALSRNLIGEAARLREGGWQGPPGRDLDGLRLGLIGLGTVGAQVARLAQVLGMHVSAWSQNLTDARCAECGVTRAASLASLMADSDVLSVHLVHSPRTDRLIGPDAFAAMRDGAVFVNTSRAGIVDTPALLAAMRAGRPAKAGLDVFDAEPLPQGDPLRAAFAEFGDRLLATPHLGYVTDATWRLFYGDTVEAIAAWQAGAPIREL